jgi:glycosyltransferase involved in cell wall biosynthesis
MNPGQVIRNDLMKDPFFSICIPQHNRTSFLIEACRVMSEQSFKSFEVCISDDCSTDGREDELIEYLHRSGLSFVYRKQEKNLRYDGNLRTAMSLARGHYCFLHGNDDCLSSSTTLAEIYEEIKEHNFPSAIVTNYQNWSTGEKTQRLPYSRLVGSGVEVAVSHFRDVAFVTGVMFDRSLSHIHSTDEQDGSEFYQMYLLARILAAGGSLLHLDLSAVRQDIQIPGETVDSFKNEKRSSGKIKEVVLPTVKTGKVVCNALMPYLDDSNKSKISEKIFFQLYVFSYASIIVMCKRYHSWDYAVSFCLGIKPKNLLAGVEINWIGKCRLYIIYLLVCSIALLTPVRLFDSLKPSLHRFAKSAFAYKDEQKPSLG